MLSAGGRHIGGEGGYEGGEVAGETHCGDGVACSVNNQLVKGREFNAIMELGYCREWLRFLRSEMDAGLGRIDAALKVLEHSGPVQGNNDLDRVAKPIKSNLSKGKNVMLPKRGAGLGLGPNNKQSLWKPKVSKITEEGPLVGLGLLARPNESMGTTGHGIGCQGHSTTGELGMGLETQQGTIEVPSEAGNGAPVHATSEPERPERPSMEGGSAAGGLGVRNLPEGGLRIQAEGEVA
jgi:hypothetical protein